MPSETLQLDSFLPYRLSIASNLVSDVISRAYVRLFGLTIPEWRLIAVLAEAEGLTQQQVALRTHMDKVTVSRAAIGLAYRGLIVRRPNPRDGRSQLLTLSEDGATLYAQVVPQAKTLEERIFGTIDADELARFSDTLDRITRAASAA